MEKLGKMINDMDATGRDLNWYKRLTNRSIDWDKLNIKRKDDNSSD